MRRILVLGLMAAAGCAGSNPTPGAAAPEQRVTVPGGGGSAGSGGASLNVVPVTGLSTHQFAYPVDAVWKILPAVFDSVAVPVGLLDPTSHTIGNRGFKLRGKLGKVPLGRYIDCGTTQIGPNAESYDITLTLTTALTPAAGGGTSMAINMEASAKPLAFAQEPFRCGTKAALEQRVVDLTNALLSR
jgi:hypothetical protein